MILPGVRIGQPGQQRGGLRWRPDDHFALVLELRETRLPSLDYVTDLDRKLRHLISKDQITTPTTIERTLQDLDPSEVPHSKNSISVTCRGCSSVLSRNQ